MTIAHVSKLRILRFTTNYGCNPKVKSKAYHECIFVLITRIFVVTSFPDYGSQNHGTWKTIVSVLRFAARALLKDGTIDAYIKISQLSHLKQF